MKKIIINLLLSILYSSEFQFGKGTFNFKSNLIAISSETSEDISTYSLVEQHENIFNSKWFYKYNMTYYTSTHKKNNNQSLIQDINSMIDTNTSQIDKITDNTNIITDPITDLVTNTNEVQVSDTNLTNNTLTQTASSLINTKDLDFTVSGLDINIILGRDLYQKNKDEYVSIGLLFGLSAPIIDSDDDSNDDSSDDSSESSVNTLNNCFLLDKIKTNINSYKYGLNISARKILYNMFTLYGSVSYAYHYSSINNEYLHTEIKTNGIFTKYDFGLRFQPVDLTFDFKYITLNPKLFVTIGYRKTSLNIDDIKVNVVGFNIPSDKSYIHMNSSETYFGIGYKF